MASAADSTPLPTPGTGNNGLPPTIAAGVPFYHFAVMCEKIATTKGKEEKKKLFIMFLNRWRESHRTLYGSNVASANDSFHIPLRFLLPQLDNERLSYGMKEVFIAKYYIDVLGISKDGIEGKMLLNYRAPSSAKQDAGDFASVAEVVLKNRCPAKGTLKMLDIEKSLEEIGAANAEKKRDVIKKWLQKLIRSTSAMEQKWLLRIMLKQMKLGANENSLLPAFHQDALELYNVCNSLSKVCVDLHDPNVRLNEAEIVVGVPFRAMLGQRVVIGEVEKLMQGENFIIETKIDGERMQVHKEGDEFSYFSRNCIEYTEQFGATKYRGSLTPHIADSFKPGVHSCILDGEMVGFDEESNTFVLKAANVDVKVDSMATGLHPCFVVFDMLLLNDEKLANVPLKDRIEKVQEVFDVTKGRLQHVDRKIGRNVGDVVSAINHAIDNREEGIVIKDPTSIYKPSKRKGSGWLKLKPEYLEGAGDDLDLLIVGGYYGSGFRRAGMISHFLLAVSANENAEDNPLFMTFGKVGSGYSDKELQKVCNQLNKHWKAFDPKSPPKEVLYSNGYREKPDVWIEPQHSIIVQIKAAEITTSDKYHTGSTLRFPRLEKFRDDKPWHQCMTYDELEELRKVADGKISHRVTSEPSCTESSPTKKRPPTKKRRVATRIERPRTVAEHLKGADLSDVKETSRLFAGKEMCVVNGPPSHPKQDLEKKLVELGATVVQNPTTDTFCLIAEKENLRVKSIIKCGNTDVVRAAWCIECINTQSIIPFTVDRVLFMSDATKEVFLQSYDKFGDSLVNPVDEKKLASIFKDIRDIDELLSSERIQQVEQEYFDGLDSGRFSLFRGCSLYVCPGSVSGNDFVVAEFRLHGGHVMGDIIEGETTHVLVGEGDEEERAERVATVHEIVHLWDTKPCVVGPRWIIDSINGNEVASISV